MIPGKAILVALPLAVGGGWLTLASHARVGALRLALEALEARERDEGESFVRTLQGAHAERQLDLLSRRHATALELAAARRNELLGVLAILASGLVFACVRVAQRVAREIEEDARTLPRPRARRDDGATPS